MIKLQSRSINKQLGLSIVELLVAMAVGLVLTLGISQIFTSNSKTMKLQNELARVQEDSRIAIELVSRAVRNADYWGCAGSLSDGMMVNHLDTVDSNYLWGFGKGVEGIDDDSAVNDVKDGTDVLILRGTNAMNSIVPDSYNLASAVMFVKGNDSELIKAGDIIAISDCSAGDIFQATNQTGPSKVGHNTGNGTPGNKKMGGLFPGCPGNNGHCLSKLYDDSASIMKAFTQRFFVGVGAGGSPSLFTQIDGDASLELVENIDNMQLLYGEDTDSDGKVNFYRNASAVGDFDNVVSIRIGIVLKTDAEVGSKKGKYSVLDKKDIEAQDKYLRRVYVQTVAIRNRI